MSAELSSCPVAHASLHVWNHIPESTSSSSRHQHLCVWRVYFPDLVWHLHMHRHRTRVAGRPGAMSRATQTHNPPWQGQWCRWSSADAVWTTHYTLLGEDNHGYWGRGEREREGGKRSNWSLIHSCSSLSALAWFCWPQLPPALLLCHSHPLTAWTCTVGQKADASARGSNTKQPEINSDGQEYLYQMLSTPHRYSFVKQSNRKCQEEIHKLQASQVPWRVTT